MRPINGLNDVRRVVSAERANGASYVASDGPPTRIEGGRVAALWATDYATTRAPINDAGEDPCPALAAFVGGHGDTRLNAMWILPEGSPEPANAPKAGGSMVPVRHSGTTQGPGWHATQSIDYMIVIRGEISCLLDEVEVELKQGDILVQGAVNHVWRNRGSEPALIYGITVGAPEKP